jgi:hypothetical protein
LISDDDENIYCHPYKSAQGFTLSSFNMSKPTFEERVLTFKPARLTKELDKIRTKKQEHSDQLSQLIKMEKLILERQTLLDKESIEPERKRMTFVQRKEMIEREIAQADENLTLFNT